MGGGVVLQVGDDLFDNRVAAVLFLGGDHIGWTVGETRVIPPQRKQCILWGVLVFDRRIIRRAVTAVFRLRLLKAV